MSELASLLREGAEQRVYSAAAWSVGNGERAIDRGSLGHRAHGGIPVDGTENWDLASVTKPIVGLAVMALVERGVLGLEDTLGSHLPGYTGGDKAELTVRQLLAHSSGLPGGVRLFADHPSREGFLDALRDLPLCRRPGTGVEYSSQGFMLLGFLAEAASGRRLDHLVEDYVCAPLGMDATRFGPVAEAVATEYCHWRERMVIGEVHDENAVVLGGICGHAGLFGTLDDLERLGMALVRGGGELLGADTFAEMTACHTETLNLRRCLGWQGFDQDCPLGTVFGRDSYGHTGFTGTSIWVDPALGRYFVLLTNRVHPSREPSGIEVLRRRFHEHAVGL
ncbi:serine hydrolase domain-containing protein [Sciscionella marina]|uniref:serine hydrolase domain-containing protein n=1 Tax=Sciscionella marina TaxID=508770 RepID=UPI00035C7F50|nr:serine hydrolase domain-containing protein [Sciscionella marina]